MTNTEFRVAMKSLGVSQNWLAERLGVHWVTVSRWANGALEVPPYASFTLDLLLLLPEGKRPK